MKNASNFLGNRRVRFAFFQFFHAISAGLYPFLRLCEIQQRQGLCPLGLAFFEHHRMRRTSKKSRSLGKWATAVFMFGMKRVRKWMLLMLAVPFISTGCAHNRERWHDMSLLRSTEYPEDTIPALTEAANSSSTEEDQARAIFTLFGRYLRPGCSSSEFHQVLTNVGWLGRSRLYKIGAYTGWIPISDPFEDTVFALYLFPPGPDKRASQWHIYFRLTGHQQEADALGFLRGAVPAASTTKMAEFALCFPHSIYHPDRATGRIERFSTRGVHVYEEMGR